MNSSELMKRNLSYIVILILTLSSCSNLKKLPAGEKLYTGATIKFTDKPEEKKELEEDLDGLIRPRPNKKFLGMRIKLSLYNLGKEPKGKGLNYLLREKWGEPPVLFSKVRPAYTSAVLRSHLENKSYFDSRVRFEVQEKEKTAHVVYTIRAGHSYTINDIFLPEDSSMVSSVIRAAGNSSLIKPGDPFDLDIIRAERERIDEALKEEGFFYFNPDFLLFEVDSTLQGKVNLYVTVKPQIPYLAKQQFRINTITIYPNYTLDKDSVYQHSAGRKYRTFTLVDPDSLFRANIFRRSVFLKPDSLYRRSSHNITLRRLVTLGPFKFIKANFDRPADSLQPLLNTTLYLTPYPKRTLQVQLSGSSKSNNFVGSEINVQLTNRNLFRGAEALEVHVGGGFETQVGGNQLSTNSYTLTGEVALNVPRFVSPFRLINPRTPYVPRTRVSLSYEQLSRTNLYTLRALRLGWGYSWQKNRYWEYTLTPLNISYTLPGNITPEFQQMLDQDLSLRQTFEKQFILGSVYSAKYNNQLDLKRRNTTVADFNVDVSGNLAGLIFTGKNDVGQKTLLSVPYSQYIRFTADFRNFWKLNKTMTWANRLIAGYGYSYGNSVSMPFVKQYFIGGSNSIRAFRARTLGPGSYQSPTSDLLASEAGDIKLEATTELRAKLFSIVNGAIFVDAGNIWLRKENPVKPGSGFSDFQREFAVGTGAGLRFDASILVVRFDLAFPLRKPWLPEGERWVLDEIRFGDRTWRRENLILNIAIGYPF